MDLGFAAAGESLLTTHLIRLAWVHKLGDSLVKSKLIPLPGGQRETDEGGKPLQREMVAVLISKGTYRRLVFDGHKTTNLRTRLQNPKSLCTGLQGVQSHIQPRNEMVGYH